ncbi:MAG: hypothetical protein HYZ84_03560 [Candidatus Omnitrophica bacterium]|nr:hypothetical protein [Candidatus Omnitrophota bacterium]
MQGKLQEWFRGELNFIETISQPYLPAPHFALGFKLHPEVKTALAKNPNRKKSGNKLQQKEEKRF